MWSGAPTSALLLRAESTQRDREQRDKQTAGGSGGGDSGGGVSGSSSSGSGSNGSGISGSASASGGIGSGSASGASRIISPVQDAWQGLWARNDRAARETGRGVDWRDLATEEDKFAWALLREKDGWKDFLAYQVSL